MAARCGWPKGRSGSGISGYFGHAGLTAKYYAFGNWGLGAELDLGAYVSTGVSLLYRFGASP